MKPLVSHIVMLCVLAMASPLAGALEKQSIDEFLDAQDRNCYMLPAPTNDHILVGCGIDGYYEDREVAGQAGVFVALLPEGLDSPESSPVLFMAHTYSLDGGTLKDLFENDLEGLLKTQKGSRLVRKLPEEDNPPKAGECAGAEIVLDIDNTVFPYQKYFFCRSYSSRYAVMVSIIARTHEDLERHYSDFFRWANVPQHVRDYDVTVIEGTPLWLWAILLGLLMVVLGIVALPVYLVLRRRKRRSAERVP